VTTPAVIQGIYDSGIAGWMRDTPRVMPITEAIHVLGSVAVFGTILIVDLRLLAVPDLRRSFTRIAREVLPATWIAFAASAITGCMMFAAGATTYFDNTVFRLKMLALLAAGINMTVFQLLLVRSVARWDQDVRTPPAVRTAAIVSISLWIALIVLGRWIGYTKEYEFVIPPDMQIDFSE
jgi:hypothetical protein